MCVFALSRNLGLLSIYGVLWRRHPRGFSRHVFLLKGGVAPPMLQRILFLNLEIFISYRRNVALLALVFKDRSSWGWAFVSLVGVLFIPLIAPSLLALLRYAPYDSLYIIYVGGRGSLSWGFLAEYWCPLAAALAVCGFLIMVACRRSSGGRCADNYWSVLGRLLVWSQTTIRFVCKQLLV